MKISKPYIYRLIVTCLTGFTVVLFAQSNLFLSTHIGHADGVNEPTIWNIGEDKYGNMWFNALSTIYRYDANKVIAYNSNISDSTKQIPSIITSITSDSNGSLFFGTTSGLYIYSYTKENFSIVHGTEGIGVREIINVGFSKLIILTSAGLAVFDTRSLHMTFPFHLDDHSELNIDDIILKDQFIYAALDSNIFIVDINPDNFLDVDTVWVGGRVTSLCVDAQGFIWALGTRKIKSIVCVNPLNADIKEYYDYELFQLSRDAWPAIKQIFVDRNNRLWIATNTGGLYYHYIVHSRNGKFEVVPADVFNGNTKRFITGIYESRNGNIWILTEGDGVYYFNPNQNQIAFRRPSANLTEGSETWVRCMTQINDSTLWIGTSRGIWVVNRAYEELFYNQPGSNPILSSNSIRSFFKDSDGNIWIGTAAGLDIKRNDKRSIFNLTQHQMAPKAFYWSINEDRDKTIWFATGMGLFYKEKKSEIISSIQKIDALADYSGLSVRSFFESSSGLIYLGFDGNGMVVYDKVKRKSLQFKRKQGEKNGLIGNRVTSFAEDRLGNIWISTFTGISVYNPRVNSFKSFDFSDGLLAQNTTGLFIDSLDRLWISSTSGIYVMDIFDGFTISKFHFFDPTRFGSLNDQKTYFFNNRLFFPTYNGIYSLSPNLWEKQADSIPFYADFFKSSKRRINTDSLAILKDNIYLDQDENDFTIKLNALNYLHNNNVLYEYKLEGYNKSWVVTGSDVIDFNNIPGGSYVFKYKSALSIGALDKVPEKEIFVHIRIPFYRLWWFKYLVALLLLLLIIFLLRYFYLRKVEFYELDSRAKLLEKEKAVVQYQSLKEQFNPHFLFNTLASIGYLIRTNATLASDYVDSMSKVYRYILLNRDNDLVTLREEILFVENIILLNRVRFNEALQIVINIHDDHLSSKIVPATLQGLIENAIKHNILDKDSPLIVEILIEDGYVVVRNNIQKKRFVETSNKIGLKNLIELYGFLTPIGVKVEEAKYFTVKIPLLY